MSTRLMFSSVKPIETHHDCTASKCNLTLTLTFPVAENLREAGKRAAIVTSRDKTSKPYTHEEVEVDGGE